MVAAITIELFPGMTNPSKREDIVERLRYTFMNADAAEIDVLVGGLKNKENHETLCNEFFQNCHVDAKGNFVPGGFFSNAGHNASLMYAMYELLGTAPESLALKQAVKRVQILRRHFTGAFYLPKGLFLLPGLEVLILREMGLFFLPDAVEKAANLRILDLVGNKFFRIPSSILRLSKLTALNLSFNAIHSLPENLNQLSSLKFLSLSGNKITQLPEGWNAMTSLNMLDMSMNRISRIPESLCGLKGLKKINFDYNDLSAADEAALTNIPKGET